VRQTDRRTDRITTPKTALARLRRAVKMERNRGKITTDVEQDIASIKKDCVRGFIRYAYSPDDFIHTARCLLELMCVKHGYSSLSLFSRDELVYAACIFNVRFSVLFLRFLKIINKSGVLPYGAHGGV